MAREAELELKNKLAARDKNALVKYGPAAWSQAASAPHRAQRRLGLLRCGLPAAQPAPGASGAP